MKPQIKCLVCPRARTAAMASVPAASANDWHAAALRLHNTVLTTAFNVCCSSPELPANWRGPPRPQTRNTLTEPARGNVIVSRVQEVALLQLHGRFNFVEPDPR